MSERQRAAEWQGDKWDMPGAWQERWGRWEHDPCLTMDERTVQRCPWAPQPERKPRRGFWRTAMVLACTSCVRFRQRKSMNKGKRLTWSLYLPIFMLLRIFPILFTMWCCSRWWRETNATNTSSLQGTRWHQIIGKLCWIRHFSFDVNAEDTVVTPDCTAELLETLESVVSYSVNMWHLDQIMGICLNREKTCEVRGWGCPLLKA